MMKSGLIFLVGCGECAVNDGFNAIMRFRSILS